MPTTRTPTRPTSRLSEPRVGPTDACEREQRHPRKGQMTLDLTPREADCYDPITGTDRPCDGPDCDCKAVPTPGCLRWGHHFNPSTGCCNRCGLTQN